MPLGSATVLTGVVALCTTLAAAQVFGWPPAPPFSTNFILHSNSSATITTVTPGLLPSVYALVASILPATYSINNTGAITFSYNITQDGTLLSLGSVDPARALTFSTPTFLLPSAVVNHTIAITFFNPASTDASIRFSVNQSCADSAANLRNLCAMPPGEIDYYLEPISLLPGSPLQYHVGVSGCSVLPDDCGGGDVCCYPGWPQTGSLSNIVSCGASCYNCSNVCSLPSNTPTASYTPTGSRTGTSQATISGTPSPSRSRSGAHSLRHSESIAVVVVAAAIASAFYVLMT